MKKIYLFLFLFVCSTMVNYAQNSGGSTSGSGASTGSSGTTSGSSTSGTGSSGGVSDAQVVRSAASQKRAGASEAQIATQLLQQGATPQQLQRLRNQYADQINKAGMGDAVDNGLREAVDRSRTNNEAGDNPTQLPDNNESSMDNADGDVDGDVDADADGDDGARAARRRGRSSRQVFGRNIFNNPRLTFAPNMNIATPQNYVLGPGDVLVVDVYGASRENLRLTVSPEGDVYVPEFGPIQVSGLQISTAQNRIRARLGRFYQNSEIRTTLGQTRSIQINVLGEVRVPGTYTLSSLSTVYHALYRAGGISNLGTLRNIKLYRQGKLVTVVDVYEFIFNGRLAGNVRLEDNDVIQVDTYDCLVNISGFVKRPMTYELRENESLSTLIKYCGGFSSSAHKETVRVFRNGDKMRNIFNVDEFDFSSFKLRNGDAIAVETNPDLYENMVRVNGAVSRPGMYQLGEKVFSVKSLVERAEGLTPDAMTNRAVIRRLKPNRTLEVLSVNLEAIMNGTEADVQLQNEDELFIMTQKEARQERTLTITGEVMIPGTYDYADNMTIEDLIVIAGGLRDQASLAKVDVSRRILDPNATEKSREIAKTFTFELKDGLPINADHSFVLEPYDIVHVRRSPAFSTARNISVTGEVNYEGSHTLENKNMRLTDAIRLAGGITNDAYLRGARLVRRTNDEERVRMRASVAAIRDILSERGDSISWQKLNLENNYIVGINLEEALKNPGGDADILLREGDRIFVPEYDPIVKISGDVFYPNTVFFQKNKGYKHYVEMAGGFGNRAKKSKTFIVYQNGTIGLVKKGAKPEPGCEIIVPSKKRKDPISLGSIASMGTSLASLATLVIALTKL